MKNEEKASISIMKIICIAIILVLISGIGVMAVNTNLNDVKYKVRNGNLIISYKEGDKDITAILKEGNITKTARQNGMNELVDEENQR